MQSCLTKFSLVYIVERPQETMTEQSTEPSSPSEEKQLQIKGTGTPAEDREEERVQSMWNLKEEAKWGKNAEIQKKAIQELAKIGLPALSYLREILTVLAPSEIRQSCEDAIRNIDVKSK